MQQVARGDEHCRPVFARFNGVILGEVGERGDRDDISDGYREAYQRADKNARCEGAYRIYHGGGEVNAEIDNDISYARTDEQRLLAHFFGKDIDERV